VLLIAVAAIATRAVVCNGAGVLFAGALLYGLASGFSAAEAGRLASRAAAQVVSQFGPRLQPHQHQELLQHHQAAGH
jgi:sugar/nucleoside kinase (ribokinase family)